MLKFPAFSEKSAKTLGAFTFSTHPVEVHYISILYKNIICKYLS